MKMLIEVRWNYVLICKMNSCLYKATVMHNRLKPQQHRFHYTVFMFYIDLDELDQITSKFLLLSRNTFNFFSFRDKEHLQLPAENPDISKTTKQHILNYLKQNGVSAVPHKIMLLTNLNVLGYNFNPVSFYFCFDEKEQPVCAIAEVSNTFREMKPYLLSAETWSGKAFQLNTTKYFYVSPFFDADMNFDFNLHIPAEKLNIRIDTLNKEERVFISTLTGQQKKLSNRMLFWYSLRFPLIPLRIIYLIHWQALLLWIKKLPFHKKAEAPHLQRNIFRRYSKK